MEKNIPFLKTKGIHSPISSEDGYRVSIMSRHTLNDGSTPDPLITFESYDEWIKELAPPDPLIGAYYKRNLSWSEFERGYLKFLRTSEVQIKLRVLIDLSQKETITLLCVEDTPDYCHRRLLIEECQRLFPGIRVTVK